MTVSWLFPSIIASLAGGLILCLTYFALFYQDREKALFIWATGWALYSVRFVFMLFLLLPGAKGLDSLFLIANQLSALFSGVIILWGTHVFVNRKISRIWFFLTLLLTPWTIYAVLFAVPFRLMSLPCYLFLGTVYIATGIILYRRIAVHGSGRLITSSAFILWGIHKIDYPFLRPVLWFAPWGYLLSAVLSLIVAIGILLIYLQTTRYALKRAQKRYQLAIQDSTDGLWDWPEIEKDTCWWSPRFYEMLGYEPGQIVSARSVFMELIHPDDREEVRRALEKHLEDNTSYDVEIRCRTASGEYRWFSERGKALRNTGRHSMRMSGSIQDIHQGKVAEQTLIQNEEKYRRLVESIRAVPWEMDIKTGKFTYLGPQFFDITGFSPEKMSDFQDWADTLHPEDREYTINYFRHISEYGEDHDFIYRAVRSNGGIIWIQDIVSIVDGEAGPEKLVGFMLDITENIQSEMNLEKTEMEWSAAMDAMDDAVYLLDLDRHIIRANKAFYLMTNSSPETAIGKHIEEIVHPEGEEDVQCRVCEAQQKKIDTTVIMEADHPHNPSGQPIEIKIKVVNDAHGQPLSIFMILHDLSNSRREQREKEKLEAQLRQAQKMEAIGTLAGGIAHDFNNILAAIMGYAEMAEEEIPVDNPARSDLEKVLRASRRARDLVRHILTFSRQSEREMGPIQPYLIVNEALKLLRASIPTTIEINQKLDKYSGFVIADPTQIHQVIMNLCTNAVHAMEDTGGLLEVILDSVALAEDDLKDDLIEARPGSYVKLTVSDTGQGIAPENLDKIFDPYFSTKETGKGTGMGLAVVHGIVQSHGGVITVDSRPGKGATFTIFFPKAKQAAIIEDSDNSICLSGDGTHILFVDDEELIVNISRKILEHLSYKVTVKSSSKEALDAFKEAPDKFDLVITDQTMPHMTGIELAREILAVRPKMPIILCTGYSELVNRDSVKKTGIAEFLMKPIGKKEFAEAIHNVLRKAGQ